MQYLQQQFAVINKKLDKIIDLQVQTLKALEALSEQQQHFRKEVLGQLDRIEDTIIRDGTLLRSLVVDQWGDCPTIINDTALNGSYGISSVDALKQIISYPNIGTLLFDCVHGKGELISLLANKVKAANWTGTMLAAEAFPNIIVPGSALQKSWDAFEFQRDNAFNTAKDFVAAQLSKAEKPPNRFPAKYVARLAQPAIDVKHSKSLATILEGTDAAQRFDAFRCNQENVLSRPLAEIMCFGVASGAAEPPHLNRFDDVIHEPLIGPLGMTVIDTGIVVAKLLMFGKLNPGTAFEMVPATDIDKLTNEGMSEQFRVAFSEIENGERKDIALPNRLSWLADVTMLQQSITYGNYTAELVEQAIYNPKTRAIDTDPANLSGEQAKALEAMKANPVIARNVVMLAMRHAIADALGGADQAEAKLYRETYYGLGLSDFNVPASCSTDANDTGKITARQKLNDLFPNWTFEYVVTAAQAADPQQAQLKNCAQEFAPTGDKPFPGRGAGVAVVLGKDFYTLVPTPMQLVAGSYEFNDSLRLALAYRDRVSQAIIDQNLGKTVRDVASREGADADFRTVATGILNEGWEWQTRKKAE